MSVVATIELRGGKRWISVATEDGMCCFSVPSTTAAADREWAERVASHYHADLRWDVPELPSDCEPGEPLHVPGAGSVAPP